MRNHDDLDAAVEMTAAHAIDTECVDITKEEIAAAEAEAAAKKAKLTKLTKWTKLTIDLPPQYSSSTSPSDYSWWAGPVWHAFEKLEPEAVKAMAVGRF